MACLARMSHISPQRSVVLVVEDEPLVMMDLIQVLEEAGFEVVDAYDGEHALRKLEQRPEINALFTDVNMPGRYDGVTLARMVHERRPDMLLIITSGAVKLERSDLPRDGYFLPKPYNGAEVVRLLRELTGG